MSIAFDAQSKDSATFLSGTSFSWSHTCTGSDRYLVVAIMSYNQQGTITAPTYNGVSMTLIQSTNIPTNVNNFWMYGLVAPDTGTNTISFSFSISNSFVSAVATSYTGVDQTTPIDVSVIQNLTPSTTSAYVPSITTTVDNTWVVGSFRAEQSSTFSLSTGTLRDGAAGIGMYNYDSNAAISPAGVWSTTFTRNNATDRFSGVLAALRPAGGGGGAPTPTLMMMGVGT